jgi:hypothetical protein
MKKAILVGIFLILVGIFMNSANAQLGGNLTKNDSDYVMINVTIATQTWVDVEPYALAWTGVNPGGVGNNATETLGPGYFAIQIENIGSRNITHVWFNATYPSASPFGRGSAAWTNAGNYVVLSNNTASTNPPANGFFFINRVEYNETTQLVYLRDPSGNLPPSSAAFTYGRFRNASNEYFWFLNAVRPTCTAATYIRIGNISHSKTQTGTTNFRTVGGGNYKTVPLSLWGANWRVGHITGGPLNGYEVAVNSTCAVFFSRWNMDRPFDSAGTNARYARSTALSPGASFAMAIKVYVDYGIYQGASGQGRIWAIVNNVP